MFIMKLIVYGWDIDDSVRHYDLSWIVSELFFIIQRNDSENDSGIHDMKDDSYNKIMKKIIQESMIISMNSEIIILYLSNLKYVDAKSRVFIIPRYRYTRKDKKTIVPVATLSNHYQQQLHQLRSFYCIHALCNDKSEWKFIHLSNNINVLIDMNNDISIVENIGHHDMRPSSSILPLPQLLSASTPPPSSASSSSILSTATASFDKRSKVRLLDCRELHSKKIRKVTCSDYHFIIMCEMVCYSYGACQYGQLGIGQVTQYIIRTSDR
jgi:hypothetical protein